MDVSDEAIFLDGVAYLEMTIISAKNLRAADLNGELIILSILLQTSKSIKRKFFLREDISIQQNHIYLHQKEEKKK